MLLLSTALAVAGTWLANAMIVLGVVVLLMRVYFQRCRAQIRHVETGEPIPALDFFEQMGRFIAISFRLWRNFNPLENVLEGGRRYGPTRVFWAGWKPLVIVSEPDDIRKLLNDKEELFYKTRALGANPTLPRVMGSSLLTVAGDKWKVQRKAMDPAFQYKKMRTLVPMFSRCARKLILKWLNQIRTDPVVRVEEGLTEMTLDAIGLGAFGYDFGAVDGLKETSENLERYHQIIEAVFRPLAFIFPFLTKVPTAYNMRLEAAISGFQDFLAHVIATHRERKSDENTEHDLDLLDHIIALDEDGQLTNEEISHNLFLFFLAGHDTSASSLTAALYFFAKYPHMQQKAYEEVLTVLGGSNDDHDGDRPPHELTLADLSKLEYLTMFLKETLRMRPPVSGATGRAVIKEEGVVLGGYLVPKGISVSPSIWCYHYDERYWPEPYTFKPERFASKPAAADEGENKSPNAQQTHDILTFSTGPRICIGKKFAMTEMLTTLALLLQTFEFELQTPDYEWRFRPIGITLRPLDGLPLRLKPRRSRATASTAVPNK